MHRVVLVSLVILLGSVGADAAIPRHASLDLRSPLACYKSMESLWNRTQAPPSSSVRLTQVEYEGFAVCAGLAVRQHDNDSYYADTIGAMFAQSWIGVLYKRQHRNAAAHRHFALARDLNKLARDLASLHDRVGITVATLEKFDKQYADLDSGKISAVDPR